MFFRSPLSALRVQLSRLSRVAVVFGASTLALRAADIDFSVTQAEAGWMPEASALRWHDGKLESLFFVLASSAQEQKGLSVAIQAGGAERVEPLADLHPISDERAAEILAKDPTWFSARSDLAAQRNAASRSVAKFWVPVDLGQPIGFELRQQGKNLASQTVTPAGPAPLWFRSQWNAKAENPVLHGQVLFPHHNLMVRTGEPVSLDFEVVGTSREPTVDATLITSVHAADHEGTLWQTRQPLRAARHALSRASVTLPVSEWAPGSYVVTTEFQDGSGRFFGTTKRGLVIVPARPVTSRFGAAYAALSTMPAASVDPAEEPPIFKGAREYHATHTAPGSDIVVSFDGKRDHLVFSHRNRGYTPFWYVNELGIDWEWVEGHDDELGSLEVQYDPECRYARASIVASTPARAIVHWRYNTSSRFYDRYFDEWVDEFYTIYPDQTAVRKIMGYFRRHNWHETFEPYLVGPAGLHLSEVFEDRHLTFMNLTGDTIDLDPLNMWKDWQDAWTSLHGTQQPHPALLRFNLRGDRKFFYAWSDLRRVYSLWSQVWKDGDKWIEVPGGREQPFPQDTDKPSAKALQTQISSYCLFDAQAALLEARSLPDGTPFTPAQLERETNNKMSQTKDMADVRIVSTWANLLGLGDDVDPVAITRAWTSPAEVAEITGGAYLGFEPAERAYRFQSTSGESNLRFTFQPQSGKPQVNPVFVIEGLTANAPLALAVDNHVLPDKDYRVGFENQPDGTYRAVIWISRTFPASTAFGITRR